MQITVHLEAQLRQAAQTSRLVLDLADGAVLETLLQHSEFQQKPELLSRLTNSSGGFHSSVLIFLNDQPVPSPVEHQLLSDGDQILLLPPISGG
ncbi:MAG: MoaD/ThiS family protein [Planctomycetaceae bacterium]